MIEKQSKEEVQSVMDGAAGSSKLATKVNIELQEENRRLNATVKELSNRVASAMASTSIGSGGGDGIVTMLSKNNSEDTNSSGGAPATNNKDGNTDATVNGDDTNPGNNTILESEANVALWNALTPSQQIVELRTMHHKLESLRTQMNTTLAEKDKEVEALSSSDSVLVRKEIVEQNQKLQLDVHNLVKDLKNRCESHSKGGSQGSAGVSVAICILTLQIYLKTFFNKHV